MRSGKVDGVEQPEDRQSRSFAEMLEKTLRAYHNRTIEAAQVIAELIELAKKMREAHKRGGEL
ncbi:type I restriction enzyme endonuclease domain-containing protein [Desulfoscipio geothermicus]|uniref:Type I restriction enzyme HindI endonuclease subunit-like C-terminal domain-containing protein n=1 Tax=Desulfoscipio geothermicus DSM 3669 TaxID=1121426 RepID=A0A1I6EL09_9FIRM|nr:type I restriction enzyme endonuclease domain-containing protein [Desulfoscipio geothermicus]SFR18453.1 protein of unknown function [Desulfoscipio geothermicus DSM 3669]